ncbi:MAG: Flp pilus assembly complex ATPase component TadA [Planctomyces sp.]|nr:Flp pilus assembly complex ATPase component TadA [Planctomyces sp.]
MLFRGLLSCQNRGTAARRTHFGKRPARGEAHVIFGIGRRGDVDDDDEDDEDEVELVLFQGALNEKDPNLKENAKLLQAGLVRAKELVSDALSRRAEMIRLEPKGNAAVASFFVDGIPVPGQRMPANAALAVTQVLKLMAGLDIKVRSKPQSGGMNAEYNEVKYLIRVDTQILPAGGERLIVRAQNKAHRLETPDDLGFSDDLKAKIRELTARKKGLILAAGPPMSGVTTTAFAILRGIDGYIYTIYSLTDMTGREVMHIRRFEGNEDDDLPQTIGRAKRAEGDILYVDPLRDADFARLILSECNDVCIVSEMAARDASDAIARLVQLVGDPQLVAANLTAVFSQKLVRLICPSCRQAYRPHPKLLAKVGLPPETKVLYRATEVDPDELEDDEEPCAKCGGVGYVGRTAMIECIEATDGMRSVIESGGDAAAIKAQARKEKMQSLQSDGVRLVATGKTSLEELQRVFQSGK